MVLNAFSILFLGVDSEVIYYLYSRSNYCTENLAIIIAEYIFYEDLIQLSPNFILIMDPINDSGLLQNEIKGVNL